MKKAPYVTKLFLFSNACWLSKWDDSGQIFWELQENTVSTLEYFLLLRICWKNHIMWLFDKHIINTFCENRSAIVLDVSTNASVL